MLVVSCNVYEVVNGVRVDKIGNVTCERILHMLVSVG